MRHRAWLYTTLALGTYALASCGDETTQPNDPQVTGPELAVAHNTWVTRRDMPYETGWPATATVPNAAGQSILYVIGGRGSTRVVPSPFGLSLDRVQAYNVSTNTWSVKAPLPWAVYETNGTAVVNGKIYVSGGLYLDGESNGPQPLSKLLAYDPARNTWTLKANMPGAGSGGVTGVINGKLYVVSTCYEIWSDGYDYWDVPCGIVRPDRSNFFRYDPATDRWVRLPKPRRTYHMGAVLYDKLYVTDGKNIEMFDPMTSQWTVKASGPQGRPPGAAVAQAGKLYLFGGSKTNSVGQLVTLRSTSVYNPLTNTWSTAAPMPTGPYGVSASRVFLDGKPRIEVVGGKPPGNHLQYIP